MNFRTTIASLALALGAATLTTPAEAAPLDLWPQCKYEDGSGQARCVWDARHMGNGEGRSFKLRNFKNGDQAVIFITHRRAHRLAFTRQLAPR